MGFVFFQLLATKGFKRYRKEAEIKMLSRFKQWMECKIFHSQRVLDLSSTQKRKATND